MKSVQRVRALLYEGLLEPDAFNRACILAAKSVNGTVGQFLLLNVCEPQGLAGWFGYTMDNQLEKYCWIDPLMRFINKPGSTHVLNDEEILGSRLKDRDLYYQELMRPHGLRHRIGLSHCRLNGHLMGLAIFRNIGQSE
jgi:hypothetical protein